MNQTAHLYRLQIIDLEMDKIQARITEIHHLIDNDQTIQAAQHLIEEKTQLFHKAHHRLRSAEESVKAVQIKRQVNEANLYNGRISNPKELQDLQKENDILKKRLKELEDEELEALIEFETAEAELNTAKEALTKAEAEAVQKHAHLKGEETQLSAQMTRLQTEKTGLMASIQADNIQKYEELRKRKNGIAVSLIDDNACTICGSTIRPALLQEAKAPDKMAYCPSCGRILYVK